MLRNKTRYLVEHVLLPSAVYSSGLALPMQLIEAPGKVMIQFYKTAWDHNSLMPFIHESDFSESRTIRFSGDDRLLIIRIGMPAAVATYQCRAVYVCYSKLDGKSFYFTSERSIDGNYLLCAWQGPIHMTFQEAPESEAKETDLVSELFWVVTSDEYQKRAKSLCLG